MTFNELKHQFEEALSAVTSFEDLEAVRVEFIGRKGKVVGMMARLTDLGEEERNQAGKDANEAKEQMQTLFQAKTQELEQKRRARLTEDEWLDLSLPGDSPEAGHLHIVSQTIAEVEDIFTRLGFTRHPVREIDWDYYAFEAL